MKLFIVMALLLLAIPLAQAASLYQEDFSRGNTQNFNLKEKDAVRVNIIGKETEIMLRSVSPEKNSAKLTIFIEGAETPQYATIQTGSKLFLDVNKDRTQDLVIQAFYISKENTVLSITRLENSQALTGQATAATTEPGINTNTRSTFLTGIIITLSIIILGLLLYFIFRKR